MITHDEATIREALSRLIAAAWHQNDGTRTAACFSIPADPQRDADLILGAAIDELLSTRAQLDEALAKLAAAPWQPARHETERERYLAEKLDEARARLAMATNYETRDAITINRTAGGFSVSRWNPYTRDSEYLSSDGARWVVLDEDDELPPFPTADAAFAALAAARKE